jgi:hypothetical protein
MTEIFKLFPLCIYKSQLGDEESDLILKYADKSTSQYINSDINGDSQYQTDPDFTILNGLDHLLPRQSPKLALSETS